MCTEHYRGDGGQAPCLQHTLSSITFSPLTLSPHTYPHLGSGTAPQRGCPTWTLSLLPHLPCGSVHLGVRAPQLPLPVASHSLEAGTTVRRPQVSSVSCRCSLSIACHRLAASSSQLLVGGGGSRGGGRGASVQHLPCEVLCPLASSPSPPNT